MQALSWQLDASRAKHPRVNRRELTLFSMLDVRERQPKHAAQAPARRKRLPQRDN